tara:strand:+ start:385 stop:696 length:312 start_codon:yes stop_codon:yes gene_type:complete
MCCIKIIRDCVYAIIFISQEMYHEFTQEDYIEKAVINADEVARLISGSDSRSPRPSDSGHVTIEKDDHADDEKDSDFESDFDPYFYQDFDFEMVDKPVIPVIP